ncbi:hypothetical protein CDO81_10085 [Roseateles puraquae]|uniref:Uncharacterized protein n=1 Tax=Roseateles puraquae TaxID=431059 RepID=A0A254NG79_9BURK|nr:hypothetical protein CDO81_10085 [Roseateles puraquae]
MRVSPLELYHRAGRFATGMHDDSLRRRLLKHAAHVVKVVGSRSTPADHHFGEYGELVPPTTVASNHLKCIKHLLQGSLQDDHAILSFGKFVKFDYAKSTPLLLGLRRQ